MVSYARAKAAGEVCIRQRTTCPEDQGSKWDYGLAIRSLEIVELSYIGGFSSQNGIFHSNGHNFASNKDFLASPDVLESRRTRLHDAQKISSIRPLGAKCELVRF